MKTQTIHPEGWAPALGYANGILMADGTLHIGGQIGWNKDKKFVKGGFIEQMEQALINIADIVRAAGGDDAEAEQCGSKEGSHRGYSTERKLILVFNGSTVCGRLRCKLLLTNLSLKATHGTILEKLGV